MLTEHKEEKGVPLKHENCKVNRDKTI